MEAHTDTTDRSRLKALLDQLTRIQANPRAPADSGALVKQGIGLIEQALRTGKKD